MRCEMIKIIKAYTFGMTEVLKLLKPQLFGMVAQTETGNWPMTW